MELLTPGSTLASHGSEDGGDGNSSRTELDDTQEPPSKKTKTVQTKKISTVEKMLGGMMDEFFDYQEKAEKRFMEFEDQKKG